MPNPDTYFRRSTPLEELKTLEPIVRYASSKFDPEIGEYRHGEYVAIAGVELPVYEGPNGSIFRNESLKIFPWIENL